MENSAWEPNWLRVSGITHLPTWEGGLFLAVVLDVFSRLIVGRGMSTSLNTELVLGALNMTLKQRPAVGLSHYSGPVRHYRLRRALPCRSNSDPE